MGSNPNKPRPRPVAPARRGKIPWSYPCCVLAGMILVLVIGIVTNHYQPAPISASAAVKITSDPSWGVMKEQTLMMDRPAQAFQDQTPPEIRWVFGGISREQLGTLFQSSGLRDDLKSVLTDEKLWQQTKDAITVRPALEILRELNPGARQKIYEVLARTPENIPQRYPFVLRGSFEDWFADCPLPKERLREVRGMVYERSNVLFFADLPFFQHTAPSNEVFLLARHVSRVPVVLARLSLQPPAEFAGLKRYWMSAEKTSHYDPLILSLARQGRQDLNVSTLLPPLPRQLLYRYPRPSTSIPRNADCVWTSMNFFNEAPDPRFASQEFSSQALQTQYRIVPKADALGDIIMLHKPSAEGISPLIHMCVQVAGDLVFTKNGGDIYQPWVLMYLEDVRALFSYEPVIETTVFRRRDRNT